MSKNIKYLSLSFILILILFEVFLRVEENTINTWPENKKSWTQFDRKLGWRHKLNFSTQDKDGIPIFLNNQSLRDSSSFDIKKTNIVALGDSYTFGDGVKQEYTWPTQLESLINSDVLNMGVCAYGVDQMALWYEEFDKVLQPKVVLLALIEEDLFRTQLTHWISGHSKNRVAIKENQITTEFKSIEKIKPNSRFFDLYGALDFKRSYLLDRITFGITYRQRAYDKSFEIIKYLNRKISSVGGTLYIIRLSSFDNIFKNTLEEMGIHSFSCSDHNSHDWGKISKDNPHPSNRGHEAIAKCISSNIDFITLLK